jgi:iron(III) transport system permease protein
MLVVLYYMVVTPLYRMVQTTLTWQPRDTINVPGAVVGEFTLFHYVRMVTGALGKIYLYTPLGHSFTVSIPGTGLAGVLQEHKLFRWNARAL